MLLVTLSAGHSTQATAVNPKGKLYETRGGRKLLWPLADATSSGSDAIFPANSKQTGEKAADANKSNLDKSITQPSEKQQQAKQTKAPQG